MRTFRGPPGGRVEIGGSSDEEFDEDEVEDINGGGLWEHFDLNDLDDESPILEFEQVIESGEDDNAVDIDLDSDSENSHESEDSTRDYVRSIDQQETEGEAHAQLVASLNADAGIEDSREDIPVIGTISVVYHNHPSDPSVAGRASVQVQTDDMERPRRSLRRVRIDTTDENSLESIGLELQRVSESLVADDNLRNMASAIAPTDPEASKVEIHGILESLKSQKQSSTTPDVFDDSPQASTSQIFSKYPFVMDADERDANPDITPGGSLHDGSPCQSKTDAYGTDDAPSAPNSDDERSRNLLAEETDDDDDEEVYCNPMASDIDENNEEMLRGDRIGSTTYSERHVLKILMEWMKKLPECAKAYRTDEIDTHIGRGTDEIATVDQPLDPDLEDSMALLWDMSAEKDVMHFLLENNILILIRDNMDFIYCPTRLKEIGLGILANLLSCPSILEIFPDKDEDLNLVERVMAEAVSSSKVPVLVQAYAVLRRVICYIRNAKPLARWMNQFLHPEFIRAANFHLASSTNVLLLGDVVTLFFTLMEVLYPPEHEQGLVNDKLGSAKIEDRFRPIVASDYVPSLCEAMSELLKHLKSKDIAALIMPPTDPHKLPQCDTTEVNPLGDRNDFVVPPGHVQASVLNGLASLCYLMKFESGSKILIQHNQIILNVMLGVFQKFNVCTDRVGRPEILDYYALAMDLLNHCHSQLSRVLPAAVGIPAYTTIWLLRNEKEAENPDDDDGHSKTHMVTLRNGETVETEISPYTLIYYNYVTDMEEKFGSSEIDRIIKETENRDLTKFHERAKSNAIRLHGSFQPNAQERQPGD